MEHFASKLTCSVCFGGHRDSKVKKKLRSQTKTKQKKKEETNAEKIEP